MAPIVVIVSYCRNERPFIRALLDNALVFADVVVLSVGTRLYTGAAEDEVALQELTSVYGRDRLWITRYDVDDDMLPSPIMLHNEARVAGVRMARELLRGTDFEHDFWALLLDGDEVPEGERVRKWWAEASLDESAVYKLSNHWYFLHPCLVAEPKEDSVVLAHTSLLTQESLSHPRERDGLVALNRAVRNVVDAEGAPMFHHYSWVRADRNGLVAKVANWGHSGDRPWTALLNEQLDALQAGRWPSTDFVHGYKLRRLARPVHALDGVWV